MSFITMVDDGDFDPELLDLLDFDDRKYKLPLK